MINGQRRKTCETIVKRREIKNREMEYNERRVKRGMTR